MLGLGRVRRLSWVSWILFNALKNANKARKRLHLIFLSGKHIYIYIYIYLHIFFGCKHMRSQHGSISIVQNLSQDYMGVHDHMIEWT